MFSAVEYRQFAKECTEHARLSKSEGMRKHFLEMAKAWMLAATRTEKGRTVLPLAPLSDPKNTSH
jgi:hypothetical protein